MSEELLKCPFCGAAAKFSNGKDNRAGVCCTNTRCEARAYYVGAGTWNRRSLPEQVKALVEAAKEAMAIHSSYCRQMNGLIPPFNDLSKCRCHVARIEKALIPLDPKEPTEKERSDNGR